MKNTISNNEISISVKKHGAELCSLKSLKNNKEYIWHADAKYWGKHAPILFPIVGCLKDNQYTYEGNNYTLSRHGFARDMEFELVEESTSKLKYQIADNSKTLEIYPFRFELYIIYELNGAALDISYEVINKGDKIMYFSIGSHPAFNCLIEENEQYLEFENKQTLYSYTLNTENGLIENEKRLILKDEKSLLLNYDLFKHDALVFDNDKINSICIRNGNTSEKVKVSFKGFPYLGIWTHNAPFICIESWYGIADSINTKGKLEEKTGIQTLEKGGKFNCSYKIEIC